MNARTANVWPFAGIVLLWGSAFCISCWLTFTPAPSVTDGSIGRSVVANILGESRMALSDRFYLQADTEYHKGIGHIRDEAFNDSIYQTILTETAPTMHIHIRGKSVQEMMPWLLFTIRCNPQDVDAYLVAAFWLASDDVARPDLAHELLKEGQCNIPFNSEIQLEDGRIYLNQGRLADAKRKFDAGLAFWPGAHSADDKDAQSDKAELLLYRGLLYEADGQTNKTIEAFEEILRMFPARTSLRTRIDELKNGEEPSILASSMWRDILNKYEETSRACDRKNDEDAHDVQEKAE